MMIPHPRIPRVNRGPFACVCLTLLVSALLIFSQQSAPSHPADSNFDPDTYLKAIYATERLVAFCKSHDVASIGTNSELVSLLEQDGILGCWYGVASTVRSHVGNFSPAAQFFRPGAKPPEFPTIKLHLSALAGEMPRALYVHFDDVKIVIIPEPVMREEPLQILNDVIELDHPYAGAKEL